MGIQKVLYRRHEREISLSLWEGWLYKRLAVLHQLTVGIAELTVGGSMPHRHPQEHVLHYVLDGSGCIEYDDDPRNRVPFEPGQLFDFKPDRLHTYFCDSSVMLLTTRAHPWLVSSIVSEVLTPGAVRRIDRKTAPSPDSECYFLVSGRLTIAPHSNYEAVPIEGRTAFTATSDILSFDICNDETRPATLLYASAALVSEQPNPKTAPR